MNFMYLLDSPSVVSFPFFITKDISTFCTPDSKDGSVSVGGLLVGAGAGAAADVYRPSRDDQPKHMLPTRMTFKFSGQICSLARIYMRLRGVMGGELWWGGHCIPELWLRDNIRRLLGIPDIDFTESGLSDFVHDNHFHWTIV